MNIKAGIKERDQLYRLIISQLFYDGYQNVAVQLANMTKAHPACPPSDKLLKIVTNIIQSEEDESLILKKDPLASESGIDLEFETDVHSLSPEAASYETFYVTAHKGPCRAATFHKNGSLIATGSDDTSIKILDVDRMIAKSNMSIDTLTNETPQQQMENHPVIRTLYDHAAEITCLEFHPEQQILVSGSRDFTVKCFEFSKPSVKKASKVITEAYEIRCLSFHPTGDYILVGTQHPIIRIYDTTTFQCYVCPNTSTQHTASITSVKYSPNANMFVTSSKDGSVKIWDGVSCKCINTFQRAHDGTEVCSVVFSKNSKYVLSSGKDSLVKLWELSTSRCLIAYTGAGVTGRQEHRSNAIFNHTEDYILFPDEKTSSLCCWDSRNADRQRLLSLGHNSFVRCIAHSPVRPAFVSCSDDFRARFWFRKMPSE